MVSKFIDVNKLGGKKGFIFLNNISMRVYILVNVRIYILSCHIKWNESFIDYSSSSSVIFIFPKNLRPSITEAYLNCFLYYTIISFLP